jgi:hypothetical protein
VIRRKIGLYGGLALVGVLFVGWQTGLVVPRLSHGPGSGGGRYGAFDRPPMYEPQVEIVNDGLFTETIEGVAQSVPGLHLLEVLYDQPVIEPGESTTVTLRYLITDCAAVPHGNIPLPVRVRRWWGGMTTNAGYDEHEYGWTWHSAGVEMLCREEP